MRKAIPYHKIRGLIRFDLHEVLEATKVSREEITAV